MLAGIAGAVRLAAGRGDVVAAVQDIYRRLQKEVDERKPLCVASGRCCHFDEYGHRLYVTTIELAVFVASVDGTAREIVSPVHKKSLPQLGQREAGCRFQIDNLCMVHSIRPFGCRIFYCDPAAELWQREQYELFHREIQQLHERFEIPYFYIEWRDA